MKQGFYASTWSLGVSDLNEAGKDIAVYPNPAKEMVNISSDQGNDITSIEIFDLKGQLVRSVPSIHSREISISCHGMAPGLYFLKAHMRDALLTMKLLIQ
jgi:hypothetical protein